MNDRILLGKNIKSDSRFNNNELERNTSYFINFTIPCLLEEHNNDNTIEDFQTMVMTDDYAKASYPKIFTKVNGEYKVKLSPDEQDTRLVAGDLIDGYLDDMIKHYNEKLIKDNDINVNQISKGDSEWGYSGDGIIEYVPFDNSNLIASEDKKLKANPEMASLKRRLKLANLGKKVGVGLGVLGAGSAAYGAGENSATAGLTGLGLAGLGLATGIGSSIYANKLKNQTDKFDNTEYLEIEPDKYYAFDKPLIRSGYNEEVTFNSDISPDSLVGGPYNSRQEARLNRPKAKAIHRGSVVLRYPGFIQR